MAKSKVAHSYTDRRWRGQVLNSDTSESTYVLLVHRKGARGLGCDIAQGHLLLATLCAKQVTHFTFSPMKHRSDCAGGEMRFRRVEHLA